MPGSVQDTVDEQVRGLIDNPLLGEPKVGILKGVRVVKFKVGPHQYLLAYQFFPKPNVIEVLDVGVHENFYKDWRNISNPSEGRPFGATRSS